MNSAMHAAPLEMKSEAEHDNDNGAATVTKALGDFQAAVDDRLKALETKTANDNKLADRLAKIETKLNRPGAGVEIKSANDNGEIEKKAFAIYLRHGEHALSTEEKNALSTKALSTGETKTLTVGTPANGGYLVPQAYGNELIKLLTQFSPIRSYARVVPISGPSLIYPRRVAGTGVTPVAVAETAARTASQPSFQPVTLSAFEMATYVDISNQALEDNSYDLEGELQSEFAEFFGKEEGRWFVNGNGTSEALGLMTSTEIASITSAVTGAFNSDDVVALYHSIPSPHAQNAVWAMNRTTLAALRMLKDANGRYLLLDPIAAGAPTTLLGRPVVEAIDMPNAATGAYPIIFGDLQGYRVCDRLALQVLRDPVGQQMNSIVRFYGRKRVGGGITHPDRFMKLKCK